jgi:hypothetical protein
MQQKQYEKTSEDKHFNDAIATVKAMHELNRDDPRAKEILRGLLATWHQKNPNAKPDAPKK